MGVPLEGCMSGRLAMNNPWDISAIDRDVFGDNSGDSMNREEILKAYAEFIQECMDNYDGVKRLS